MAGPLAAAVLEPLEPAHPVAVDEDHLRTSPSDQLPHRRPRGPRILIDDDRLEVCSMRVLEPLAAADQIELAVAVHVKGGQPFSHREPRDRNRGPRTTPPRLARDRGKK